MPLAPSWESIALRLGLATLASLVIGLNRDEKGRPAGMRTTTLVGLASTLTMLLVNLMLDMAGKPDGSFVQIDLMRLPLGILSGIGFIGGGVILKRDNHVVTGVTTAATLWYVTVLGLLFGSGRLVLAVVATVLAVAVLWGLKRVEAAIPRHYRGRLCLTLGDGAPGEGDIRARILRHDCRIVAWKVRYEPATTLASLECDITWRDRAARHPDTPANVAALRSVPGVVSLVWNQE